jgi:Heterokaryon incompatibility protein (HET)
MALCERCNNISLQELTEAKLEEPKTHRRRRGIVLFPCALDLRRSAGICTLCSILYGALSKELEVAGKSLELEEVLGKGQLWLLPRLDENGSAFPVETSSRCTFLSGLLVRAPVDLPQIGRRPSEKLISVSIRLFQIGPVSNPQLEPVGQEEVTAQSLNAALRQKEHPKPKLTKPLILPRRRLPSSDCHDAHHLVLTWLTACQKQHQNCSMKLSGQTIDSTLAQLPSRVIDVGSLDGITPPRLLDANGMQGEYVALSHCWGPREQRPLITNRSNLWQHLKEIPWTKLPKTFQDAITVVRNINIKYLWIDSLCILQDDEQDWKIECKKMGSVYEQASLTIAASHSPDSHAGLFLARPPPPPTVELPSFFKNYPNFSGALSGVFATTRSETAEDTFPERGALNDRAWATQEWLLARRIVFYTKGQLVWSCKTLTQRETGEKCYSTARNAKWKNVVEHYSERKLTIATDRLIALEGLRNVLHNDDTDMYLNGLWRNALPDQLLWQVNGWVRGKSNPLNQPNWTWVSVPCGVKFMLVERAKSLCEGISWKVEGELVIRAKMQRLFCVQKRRRDSVGSSVHRDSITAAITDDFAKSNVRSIRELAWYVYSKAGGNEGWITFDLDRDDPLSEEQLFCLAVMGSISRREEEKEQRLCKVVSKKLRHYWILVLRQSESASDVYERVGVGKLYGREWWMDEVPKDVRVV